MCWILKLLYNEIFGKFDWVLHLEIYKSLTLIQLLTHYTKSFLKSLINQLTHHTITSSLTHSPHITHSVFSSLPHLICTHSSQIYSLRHTLTNSLPHPLTLTHTPYHSQPHSLMLQFNWNFIPHENNIPSLFYTKQNLVGSNILLGLDIQSYPERMRLQRLLQRSYTVCFLIFIIFWNY